MEKKKTNSSLLAAAMVFAAGCFWGCIGVFSKYLAAYGMESLEITSVRLTGGAVILGTIFLICHRKAFLIHPKDIWMFLGTGICSFVFFNWCYFNCIALSSLSVAAILLYTAPSFVMVMSLFLFGEKMHKNKVWALLLTLVGCILVTGVTGEDSLSVRGLLFGVGAGFGYALYSIFGRYALKKYETTTVVLWTNLCGGIAILPLISVKHMAGIFVAHKLSIVFALGLVFVASIIPLFLYTAGLTHLENSKASIIATIEPVVAAILGMLLFQETLTISKTVGICFVIFGVMIASGISFANGSLKNEKMSRKKA